MTTSELGEIIDAQTIRFERLLPGPIERVWSYLVESDKRAKWLCAGDISLDVGGPVDMVFNNESLSDEPDIDIPEKYREYRGEWRYHGTVTRCEPPRLVAHTWMDEEHASEVCYELTEAGDQVRLVVTHTRLKDTQMMAGACGGWHAHLNILADVLANRRPKAFWQTHATLESTYESLMRDQGVM
ncbi:MAG: SRPBCC family protein [Pseudomonadota bacterium]